MPRTLTRGLTLATPQDPTPKGTFGAKPAIGGRRLFTPSTGWSLKAFLKRLGAFFCAPSYGWGSQALRLAREVLHLHGGMSFSFLSNTA